jgi:tripartite-type tricarboxylate transporter receptor subunit TctC
MNPNRPASWLRTIAACLVALAAVSQAPARAQSASTWSSKPIKIIVPYAAGGGTDIVARLVGSKLAESLGRPVIVDNRPGGRMSIAYEAALQDKADGHTLLFNNSSHNIQAAYKGLRCDPATDFTPVSEVAISSLVFVVTPNNPSRTLAEFIAWTRKRPQQVSFGSFGVGTGSHLAGEILNGVEGIDMTHVAYKGSAPALNDLLGEQIQALFVDPAAAIPYVKSGRLRALAVTGSRRWKAYADIPTFGELGYKDLSSVDGGAC